jgi:hypothetical protein
MNDNLQKYKNLILALDELRVSTVKALNSVLSNNSRTRLAVSNIVITKDGIKLLGSEIKLYDNSGYPIMPQTSLRTFTVDELRGKSNRIEEILYPYLLVCAEIKKAEVLAGEDLYYELRFN